MRIRTKGTQKHLFVFPVRDQHIKAFIVEIVSCSPKCLCVQEDKIYVQHRLLEHSFLVWDLLVNKQGWFYIAGYDKCSFALTLFPLTLMSDQDKISPYNTNTISTG